MQAKQIIDDFEKLIDIAKQAITEIAQKSNQKTYITELRFEELEYRKDNKYYLTFHGEVSCGRGCCLNSEWDEIELGTLQQIIDNKEHYFKVTLPAEIVAENSAKEEKRLAEEKELAELQIKKLAEIERTERETFLRLKEKYDAVETQS